MIRRQRLLIENIQCCSFDAPSGKSTDHSIFVYHWAASHIDHHRIGLHSRKFAFADHSSRLFRQRRSDYHIVAQGKHLDAAIRSVGSINQLVLLAGRCGVPRQRVDGHAKWMHAGSNRASDISVADDSECLASDAYYVELFPNAGDLVADHSAKVFCEIQDCCKHELPQRATEYPHSVGENHGTFDELREQRSLETYRARMHPSQIGTHSKDFSK